MSGEGHHLKIKLQVYCGGEIAMGPGKADLLEAIAREGSISAAGRALGMSYRRAWLLVDAMNRCWREPLVSASPGGPARGGARVTPFGREVLARFRALQAQAFSAQRSQEWQSLEDDILPAPRPHQKG